MNYQTLLTLRFEKFILSVCLSGLDYFTPSEVEFINKMKKQLDANNPLDIDDSERLLDLADEARAFGMRK